MGRIVLEEGDLSTLDCHPDLSDTIRHAYSSGYQLLYLLAPPTSPNAPNSDRKYLGNLVDNKTVYGLSLQSLDLAKLCSRAFCSARFKIRPYQSGASVEKLKELAVTSGAYSRFNVDQQIPRAGYHAMFHAWMDNSLSRKVADEVFVAIDGESGQEVGFVTVKCKHRNVNIGLLAVQESYRRAGLATALLSRAALWAVEQLGSASDATMDVVTQGANEAACKCYEHFGFSVQSRQAVYHVWLPADLPDPSHADNSRIPFCKQHFTGKELENCAQLFAQGIDSAGRYNAACSSAIQERLGAASSRVLIVPSGTAALEMAALLCDLQHGDEVILPSYTFSSTANAFVLRGAVPVFVDVRPDTLNLDERLIEAAITSKTRAICAVHYAGVCCEMDTICSIARRHGLKVIEDAAQAYLSSYKGRPAGSLGDFGCFSFHYTKNLVCGEGGALSVNRSDALARRALVLWEKGTNRYDFVMGRISRYEWIDLGSSFVPSELSCAVLLPQLQAAQEIHAARKRHFERYRAGLAALRREAQFSLCVVPDDCATNAHIFFVVFATAQQRRHVQEELRKQGVAAFTHYIPLHSAPAGRKYGRVAGEEDKLPVTERVYECVLRLPMWADLTNEQVDFVIQAIETATRPL